MITLSPSTSNEDGASVRSSSSSSGWKRASGSAAGELQRVRHAPDPVDVLDHQVLALDRGAVHVLRGAEHVLDDLEHVGEGRQREHQHHQAADARRDDELVVRVAQVRDQVAEEHRLALLAQAEHGVELLRGLLGMIERRNCT